MPWQTNSNFNTGQGYEKPSNSGPYTGASSGVAEGWAVLDGTLKSKSAPSRTHEIGVDKYAKQDATKQLGGRDFPSGRRQWALCDTARHENGVRIERQPYFL